MHVPQHLCQTALLHVGLVYIYRGFQTIYIEGLYIHLYMGFYIWSVVMCMYIWYLYLYIHMYMCIYRGL